MNKYCIITPTYEGHFKYITEYLRTFDKYVEDKNDVTIVFTVNHKEISALKKITSPHIDKIDIVHIDFDQLLIDHSVFLSPENLLKKYGRYSFQTLKKFYTMLSVDAEKYLVLDSETTWIQNTNMKKMFDKYFSNPTIWGSEIDERMDYFTSHIQSNIDYILGCKSNIWFIENFMWYYEKNILLDLFQEHGSPIEIVDKVFKNNYIEGVFEILLYYNYIYQNIEKYNYSFVNITKYSKNMLSPYIWENYYFRLTDFYGGACGVLERTMSLIDENNSYAFANLFKELGFDIIRSDGTDNAKEQKDFIKMVSPHILAASQDNPFVKTKISFFEKIIKFLKKRKKRILCFWKKISPSYKVALDNRNMLWYNEITLRKFIDEVEQQLKRGK